MWPHITYEECAWDRNDDDLLMIPRSKRRKITATYLASVPAPIADASWAMPEELAARSSELRAMVARFDQDQASRGYDLPALMLRSESSSSSQIERLTSSVRNVALAELSDKAPANALLIAGNVAAMREALFDAGPMSVECIERIHCALMRDAAGNKGVRCEQVWIGGSDYSPHGARFVPPHASRVRGCLDDLLAFARREDVDPLAKAAIFHAQFEVIHPFTDGNGRTGRVLVHRMLADDEVLMHASLPVSAGLLHNVGTYMDALDAYHEGDVAPIVTCILDALELALVMGARIAGDIDMVLNRWSEITADRAGSASLRLPALLVQQPVVDVAYLSARLGITDRAARSLVDAACQRGILTKMGNARRGAFYQASELIDILEEASSAEGIRRLATR